jgi:hypothetical protein
VKAPATLGGFSMGDDGDDDADEDKSVAEDPKGLFWTRVLYHYCIP